jgi:hypothetical protein
MKTLLPSPDRLDMERLLIDAEALHQACLKREQDQRYQWGQTSFQQRWDLAIADLTRNLCSPLVEALSILADAWHRFSQLLGKSGRSNAALQLEADADDAQWAAVELFHYAARGASPAEFIKLLALIANRTKMFSYKDHVLSLARQLWAGTSNPCPATPVVNAVTPHYQSLNAPQRSYAQSTTAKAASSHKQPTSPILNDLEENILQALGASKLTGAKIARKAGYPFNSNFRSTLASLRRRGILTNAGRGYQRAE